MNQRDSYLNADMFIYDVAFAPRSSVTFSTRAVSKSVSSAHRIRSAHQYKPSANWKSAHHINKYIWIPAKLFYLKCSCLHLGLGFRQFGLYSNYLRYHFSECEGNAGPKKKLIMIHTKITEKLLTTDRVM